MMQTFAKWVVIGMTGTVAGCVIYLAANGGNAGLLISGTCIAVFGIFVSAVYLRDELGRDNVSRQDKGER